MAREIPEQTYNELDLDAVLLPPHVSEVIAQTARQENLIGAFGLVATVTVERMRDANGDVDLSELEPDQVAGSLLVTKTPEGADHTIVGQLDQKQVNLGDGVKTYNSLKPAAEKVKLLLGGVVEQLTKLPIVKAEVNEPEAVTPVAPVENAVVPAQRSAEAVLFKDTTPVPQAVKDPVIAEVKELAERAIVAVPAHLLAEPAEPKEDPFAYLYENEDEMADAAA